MVTADTTMEAIPLRPQRKAQLEEYARRHGQDPASALDDALANYLEWVYGSCGGNSQRLLEREGPAYSPCC